MRIPLPKMMRHWREREFERHLSPAAVRYGLGFWAYFAKRPALYRFATDLAMRVMGLVGRSRGRFAWAPLAGGCAWQTVQPVGPPGWHFRHDFPDVPPAKSAPWHCAQTLKFQLSDARSVP